MVKKNSAGQEIILLVDYLERLLNWKLWIDKADELLTGSKALEILVRNKWNVITADFKEGRYNEGGKTSHRLAQNVQGPYFVLVAYALENLFKAVIIQQQEKKVREQVLNTRRLPKVIEGHDLVALAQAVGLAINVSEEDLLTRLSWNSIWAGRYPVPVDCGGLRNVKVYSDGKAYLTAYFSPNDVERLNALIERVKTHVRSALHLSNSTRSQ